MDPVPHDHDPDKARSGWRTGRTSLAGLVLVTIRTPWAGGRPTVGEADWGLYVPVHHNPVTGMVLAKARVSIPRRR
ncbi:hypothetical protein [Streptomyces sp. NPDC060333]|uniref:hypothetical protein n=1 Tax=Streptomyces sp. NPDC060333 TaxID=3347098 RepID=UPI003651F943